MIHNVSAQIGERNITFETGKMAKQADGSVVVSCGETMVLVTVVAEKANKDVGFLPLTVEYQEKMYAAGRIPGSAGSRLSHTAAGNNHRSPSRFLLWNVGFYSSISDRC